MDPVTTEHTIRGYILSYPEKIQMAIYGLWRFVLMLWEVISENISYLDITQSQIITKLSF